MRLEIDIKELAGELGDLLRPDLEELRASSLPGLVSCKDAARYLGVSTRMLESPGIPRVEIHPGTKATFGWNVTPRCWDSMQKIGGCATDASGSESDERHLREGAP